MTDVERLNAQVAAIQQKLDDYEEILRNGNRGTRPGSAESRLRERSRSSPRRSITETTLTINLEMSNGKPEELVVDDRSSGGIPTTYTNFSSPFRSDQTASPPHVLRQPTQLVAQLDLVVVAMEFVLKYVLHVNPLISRRL